ncbi:MAG: prepilin-type N-terminal cleavage/methylation domain-containing protein [Opitutaceae bacterium]
MKPRPRVPPFFSLPTRGFTLIEVMTVMLIVGVLIGILFPVLGLARAKARQAKCGANLHSISNAFDQFAADNHGYYPGVTYNTGHLDGRVNPNGGHWWIELKPYVGTNIKVEGGIEGSPFAICPDGLTGMNGKLNYYFQTPRVTIGQPARIVLLGDSKSHVLSVWIGDPTGASSTTSEPQRHRGRANYLFVDGHVESLTVEDASKACGRDPYAQ